MSQDERDNQFAELEAGVERALNEIIARRGRDRRVWALKNAIHLYVHLAYIQGRQHAVEDMIEGKLTFGKGGHNGHTASKPPSTS